MPEITSFSKNLLVLLCIAATLFGCASRKTFTLSAQAGDTVVLGIGWYPEVTRNDLTLTITPATGSPVVYLPGDPAVRAVVNLFPDPVSKMLVDAETQVNPIAFDSYLLETAVTGGDKEYSEKFVLIDLPTTLSTGQANIAITSATGDVIRDLKVEILPGLGASNPLGNYNGWTISDTHLQYFERAPHYSVDFSGSTIPYAIQIDMTHNPDQNNGGTGIAYVTNTRGDLKNITWSDTGTDMRVLLIPTSQTALADMQHFRFYVAGGLGGLLVNNVSAFDINGMPVGGVSANVIAYP